MHINKISVIDNGYQGVITSISKSLIYKWVVLKLNSMSTVTIFYISKTIIIPIRKVILHFIQQAERKNYFIRVENNSIKS